MTLTKGLDERSQKGGMQARRGNIPLPSGVVGNGLRENDIRRGGRNRSISFCGWPCTGQCDELSAREGYIHILSLKGERD